MPLYEQAFVATLLHHLIFKIFLFPRFEFPFHCWLAGRDLRFITFKGRAQKSPRSWIFDFRSHIFPSVVSMDLHGFPSIPRGFLKDFHGFPWISMDFHGLAREPYYSTRNGVIKCKYSGNSLASAFSER